MVKQLIIFCFVVVLGLPVLAQTDPTAPPAEQRSVNKKSTAVLPSLQAVIQDGQQSGAILNQQFVALKESVSGYTLTRVGHDHVVLARAGKHYKIQLDKVSVKQLTGQGQ
ncbi:hypothetical protein [Agarivorans sp.]|uniref:hypothetical protein n=1 Tax=Agarivorans sp. TaxID=1872412 RepID=UPI003D094495